MKFTNELKMEDSFSQPGNIVCRILLKYGYNKRGRGMIMKNLIRVFPKLNNNHLVIRDVEIPLNLTNNTDIGYFYGNGISHETFFKKLLFSLLDSQTVFYDIGANIGYYSFLTAPSIRQVYAFEPNPVLARRIEQVLNNFPLPNILLKNIGLGKQNAIIPFYVNPSLHDQGSFIQHEMRSQKLDIAINTLDSIIRENNFLVPDVIKIDTEGFELDILEGYSNLALHKPLILMEWLDRGENEQKSFQRLQSILRNGYYIYRIDPEYRLIPFEVGQKAISNLLLIPMESHNIHKISPWITTTKVNYE